MLLTFAVLLCIAYVTASHQVITVDWHHVDFVSNTTLTLQVVANPVLDPKRCPKHADAAWGLLQELVDAGASYVRFVPWFPYPRYSVGELAPPQGNKTFWDFSEVIPQLSRFLNATKATKTVLNFSTQPAWMYTGNWSYPSSPTQVDWTYSDGKTPYSNTTEQLAGYYSRLVSWLVHGHFVDEVGKLHVGGPAFTNIRSDGTVSFSIKCDLSFILTLDLFSPLAFGSSSTSPTLLATV